MTSLKALNDLVFGLDVMIDAMGDNTSRHPSWHETLNTYPGLGIVPRIHPLACCGRCGSCVEKEGGGGDLCFGGEKGVVAVRVLEEDPDQLQGMARSKKPVTREEIGNTEELRGGSRGRRPQTTSYRKSKESARVTDASDVDERNKMNRRNKKRMEKMKVKIKIKKRIDEEGEEKGEDQAKEGEQEDSEEVEVRSHEKAHGKSKRSSRKMVQEAEYDISKPCPGGPSDQTILSSFNNHVAAATWNNEHLRRMVDVVLKWRSLPPGEADMASAFKMANDVLMHLTGKGVASSATTTSGGNEPARKSEHDSHAMQSQFHTNVNESSSSKRREQGKLQHEKKWSKTNERLLMCDYNFKCWIYVDFIH
ncbi:hypothetical protein Sjap_011264 [Stephania japonica]|uniref:Uncharacterized protein n=1 Tax=Stephania japonica TaxID=461633 RepID=A0AAP0P4K3_9MAGN